MISNKEINIAKHKFDIQNKSQSFNDRVKICYQWIDAQKPLKSEGIDIFGLKGYIENWAGYYIQPIHIKIAIQLHPEIKQINQSYNISPRLIEPSINRLNSISNAFSHCYRSLHNPNLYSKKEIC